MIELSYNWCLGIALRKEPNVWLRSHAPCSGPTLPHSGPGRHHAIGLPVGSACDGPHTLLKVSDRLRPCLANPSPTAHVFII